MARAMVVADCQEGVQPLPAAGGDLGRQRPAGYPCRQPFWQRPAKQLITYRQRPAGVPCWQPFW